MEKIAELRKLRDQGGFNFDICIDGGVNGENAGAGAGAGASRLIAGSAIFNSGGVKENVARLSMGCGGL
jgi:ribulose-phosphate 3-epimerase